MFHRFRIETDEENPHVRKVSLDGKEVEGVVAADVCVVAGEIPTVKLEIVSTNVDIDLEADVTANVTYIRQLLNQPIECLDLPNRAYNALRRGVVRINGKFEYDRNQTIADVVRLYRSGRLKQYYQLGKKTYREIENKLIDKGLVGGDVD